MDEPPPLGDLEDSAPIIQKKKYKFGIVYLSYIPDGLNVKFLREIMSQFGEVGRIFLEAEKTNKKYKVYTEGWVEFKKKRVAKLVAEKLNGKPLQYGRKHCKMNGQIWSIKYLHRFKWAHLIEQINHNKAVSDQKRRFEMSQAKKQAEFYQEMIYKSQKLKRKTNSDNEDSNDDDSSRRRKSCDNPKKYKHVTKTRKNSDRRTENDPQVDDLMTDIFKPL